MQTLQYVIVHHTGIPEPHYDLMFETRPGSDLATWRSPVWPIESSTSLTRLKDHRRLYLNYVGHVPGDRGSIQQIARGTCEVEIGEDAVWTIGLLTGTPPTTLILRQIDGEMWEGGRK